MLQVVAPDDTWRAASYCVSGEYNRGGDVGCDTPFDEEKKNICGKLAQSVGRLLFHYIHARWPSLCCTIEISAAEASWTMWGSHSCEQMQDGWQVCTTTEDVNHGTVMANCTCVCTVATAAASLAHCPWFVAGLAQRLSVTPC
jgi:hypothetical protein